MSKNQKKVFQIARIFHPNHLKKRKKGSILLELLGLLPIFFLIAWGIMQVIFYISSQSTVYEAANEAARFLSTEYRGSDAVAFPNPTDQQWDRVLFKIQSSTENNHLILLFHDASQTDMSSSITKVWENESTCSTDIQSLSNTRVICVYSDDAIGSTPDFKQREINVEIKSPFYFVGSFIPHLGDYFILYGHGVAQREMTDRFQY